MHHQAKFTLVDVFTSRPFGGNQRFRFDQSTCGRGAERSRRVEVVRKDSGALGIRIGGRCAIVGEGAVFLERGATSAQARV
jgi:hypothetical protein